MPRLTNIGPFVSKTPKDVIKSTEKQLNSVTKSGLLDVGMDSLHLVNGMHSVLGLPDGNTITISGGSSYARYHGPSTNDTDYMFITMDSAIGYLSETEGDKWDRMLSYWVAHEYTHRMLEDYAGRERWLVNLLQMEDLFVEDELSLMDNLTGIQGSAPTDKETLISRLESQDTNAPTTSVEALANMVATQFSGLSPQSIEDAKDEYSRLSSEFGVDIQEGRVSHEWMWRIYHIRGSRFDLRHSERAVP